MSLTEFDEIKIKDEIKIETKPQTKTENEIETREFKDERGNKHKFNFFVIDKPEKWKSAKEFTFLFELNRLGSSNLKIPLHGVSYADWLESELSFPLPERKKVTNEMGNEFPEPEADYLLRTEDTNNRRATFRIEKATGIKIPGETIDEKLSFLLKRSVGEIKTLSDYIYTNCTGNNQGEEIQRFNELKIKPEIAEFKGFEDWEAASEVKSVLRFQRQTENFIIEIPLKNISQEDKLKIDAEASPPEPPRSKRKFGIDGKPLPITEWEPNYDDPTWKKSFRAATEKRNVMLLESCLMFQLPGANHKEKYDWLGARILGDVNKVIRFIDNELCGYRDKYDFFIS